jgi:transcriptional regulator with XRE-family HTH domain
MPSFSARAAGPPATLIARDRAVSLFLRTDEVKHYFAPGVKHCIRGSSDTHNQGVLESKELGRRIKKALEDAGVTGADLAAACRVSPQAVSGWKRTGRVHKSHIPILANLTGKSVEYFLSENVPAKNHQTNPTRPWLVEEVMDEQSFLIVFRTWQDARATDRENLVAIAKTAHGKHGTRRKRTA